MVSNDLLVKLLTDDLLERSGSQPIYLSQVEVNGGQTFSNDFFKKLFQPMLSTSDYTLKQLVEATESVDRKLKSTNVFKLVDVSVHLALVNHPITGTNYNKDKPLVTKVLIDLVPVTLNIAQAFLNYNDEDYLNVRLNYLNNNFNNNGEAVRCGVNYNPYKPNDGLSTSLQLLLSLADPLFKLFVDLVHRQENQEWQGNALNATGGKIGLLYAKDRLITTTGFGLFKKATDTSVLNSSIFNKIQWGNVDRLNAVFPTNGATVEVDSELTSSDTDVSFAKSDVAINLYKSFFSNFLTFQNSLRVGNITAFSGAVHSTDKFYLGGAHSFRGFTKNALDVNGGLQYAKLSSTVFSKLGWLRSADDARDPLRLYGTLNVGNVSDNLAKSYGQSAVSTGLGLRYCGEWATFDLGWYAAQRIGGSVEGVKNGFDMSLSVGASNV